MDKTLLDAVNPVEVAEIKDIYLASYLHSLGYEIVKTISDGFQASFYFKDVPSSTVLDYFNGGGAASPRKLFDSFQSCRRVSRQLKSVSADDI